MKQDFHPLQFVPYAQDPLEKAAESILHRFGEQLPDLSRVVVIVPNGHFGVGLRGHLLSHGRHLGCSALLGPHVNTLRRWVERVIPGDMRILNEPARELMLVEALMEHPLLFGAGNPWAVAASLIDLFDEFTLQQVVFPAQFDDFTRELRSAYGAADIAAQPLTNEARLVHTLWQAWHIQISAEGAVDGQQAYLSRLAMLLKQPDEGYHYYFIGPHRLYPAERELVKALTARGRATLFLQGEPQTHPLLVQNGGVAAARQFTPETAAPAHAPPSPYSAFLDTAFQNMAIAGRDALNTADEAIHAPFDRRAREFSAGHPASPAQSRLFVFAAHSPEHEARAVDLQIRRWLLEGRRRLAVVTEDRRLARRVRALLERADVRMRDTAGWALSTTSAAAALERWLETVEEDFHHQPLIDLLRSPFVLPRWERGGLQTAVFRLEQDVIINENVARGLARYRFALRSRLARLGTSDSAGVFELLQVLEQAAAPLRGLCNGARHPPRRLLDALDASLAHLGLYQTLGRDAAGEQVVEIITQLRRSLEGRTVTMNWIEFRNWLGAALERGHFVPAAAASNVELFTLELSALGRFDAVIIAGLDRSHLPGDDRSATFFNNAVRGELGLPTSRQRHYEKFYHFRRLLESAPQVLLTACAEKNGERVPPSQWLQLLQAFHEMAYRQPLHDNGLHQLLAEAATQVIRSDDTCLPGRKSYPAPRVDPALIPRTMTATSHQQLIDCPYQFFAARCLKLSPPEPVTEKLKKSQYGEHVHRVLQAFHSPVPGLPGPFPETLTEDNRNAAVQMLQAISRAVFAQDLEDNFLHRGWLQRWRALLDDYVDWQVERSRQWRVKAVEVGIAKEDFSELFGITGRLDRIDDRTDGIGIIDYKTGNVPGKADIDSGEAVQLPFYALLMDEPVLRVEYLTLDKNSFGNRVFIEHDQVSALRDMIGLRLKGLMEQIHAGAALPAWGDEQTCSRCSMGGLCRKQAWQL